MRKKTAFASMLVLVWGLGGIAEAQEDPNAVADGLEERLRDLQRGTRELTADVGESYRRLAGIRMDLFEHTDGALLTITHEDAVGPFYRLVEATYAIDGEPVFHQRDESGRLGAADLEVHAGALAPGAHVLTVVLRYDGDGGTVFRYVDGYHFVVRGSHAFVIPEGERMRLGVDAYAHPDRGYTERLDTVFVERLEPIR